MVTFGFLLRQELVFLSVRGEDVEGTTFGLSPFLTVAPLLKLCKWVERDYLILDVLKPVRMAYFTCFCI